MEKKMSSSQSTVVVNSNSNELNWVVQIRRTLDEELEDEIEVKACIFNVPKTLVSSKPDCYIPQQVGIGPYHYWRPELYEMGKYKLAAAKRLKKQLQIVRFEDIVVELAIHEPRIRDSYHKYLDFNSEALAWIMAVDASFLLEVLQIYSTKDGNSILKNVASSKSTHNSIVRDIVMLENQIPLFILTKILEFKFSSSANEVLNSLLMGFCQELSPFKIKDKISCIQVSHSAHILDYLYDMIIPSSKIPLEIMKDEDELCKDFERESVDPSHIKKLHDDIWNMILRLSEGLVYYIKKSLTKPLNLLLNLPIFAILKKLPLKMFFPPKNEEDTNPEEANKPPLIEEIMIPSVTQLYHSGVRFLPAAEGDDKIICFDEKTVTLYLPTISLDVNSEAVLRNLIAYEASTASGPTILARYTEFMRGIIDTEEDAKLLRERGIVLNRLKSDEEVANLWNGMSQSMRMTKVPFFDKVIEDVNKYYSRRWKVKFENYMKKYVFGSWMFLTFLAAILFLAMTFLQSFCSVYSCSRVFRIAPAE